MFACQCKICTFISQSYNFKQLTKADYINNKNIYDIYIYIYDIYDSSIIYITQRSIRLIKMALVRRIVMSHLYRTCSKKTLLLLGMLTEYTVVLSCETQ